jgi:hypothetical protein
MVEDSKEGMRKKDDESSQSVSTGSWPGIGLVVRPGMQRIEAGADVCTQVGPV